MKKCCVIFLVAVLMLGDTIPAFAAVNGGNAATVSSEMTTAEYWKENCVGSADDVLIDMDGIKELNARIMKSEGTNVYDMENMAESYNADTITASLVKGSATPDVQYYIKGKAIDNEAYFSRIRRDIKSSSYKGTKKIRYAVASTHADIKAYPTNDVLMDSLTDTADEIQTSALLVNEPFVIKQKCKREGTTFYWGYSQNVTGWVDGADLAICENKEQWLEAWKIDDMTGKDFIVVTQDKLRLDRSTDPDYPQELFLGLGTILKLVPQEKIPAAVGERGTWSNYVVYIPGRDDKGNYVQKMGLIAAHNSVNEGFLPYTQANVLDLAFACQGNRYGWGDMMGNMDCSGFVRNTLRCFGINFPRNTAMQKKIEGTVVTMTGFKDSENIAFLKTLPAGTLLYFSGHTMFYLGMVNNTPYVISSAAALSDAEGELNVVKYLSVLVTPLTVRRGNGKTWLWNLTDAVVLPVRQNLSGYTVTAEKRPGQSDDQAVITVSNGETRLVYGKDFTVINPTEEGFEGYATVVGMGGYTGLHARTRIGYNGCVYTFGDVADTAWYASAVRRVVDAGLMAGTSGERFMPDKAMTRAEMVSALYRYEKSPAVAENVSGYSDVPAGVYYEAASKWAASLGLFAQEANGAFNGNAPITREEFVSALYILKGNEGEGVALDAYADAAGLSESSVKAFGWAVKNSIIKGYADGRLAPGNTLTRAQFATVLCNMID